MLKKTIQVPLSVKGIQDAIKELAEFQRCVCDKTEELTKKLAEIGLEKAKITFASSMYNDGSANVNVEVQPIENGYKVVANGEEVCFIEFGAGVYYNGSEPYPEDRPNGIVGIGEYGSGQGKNEEWSYTENGVKKTTHGTKATMPMYNAGKEMRERIEKVIEEVFV